ncbi:hypothetical protein [Adhaeribacter pallidiroseus]|uniref:UPF0323 domain-containing protein n=1 Tax=Adhaeribacter pallidiroseus TaxID=2072847 RepID=A0A369QJC6_9BACT|nr:hypothetical protein [Adhaeribacter pallidiroseus]RDC63357.1 hypothetical protein AHMF7616_01960 [Adhaeribacter pallidiroseus]
MKKRYHIIGDLKRNVLILAAASSLGLASCNSGGNTEQDSASSDWSTGTSTLSKGVITEMTETSPDNWKITDERPAGAGQVAAILRHYDGKIDTLTGEPLQRAMNEYASVHPSNTGGFSMMNVLMWSSIGYMAGRMMSPNPAYYANPAVMNRTSGWRNSIYQERQQNGGRGGYYGSGAYRSQTATRAPQGRSGYFSGRRSGFSA